MSCVLGYDFHSLLANCLPLYCPNELIVRAITNKTRTASKKKDKNQFHSITLHFFICFLSHSLQIMSFLSPACNELSQLLPSHFRFLRCFFPFFLPLASLDPPLDSMTVMMHSLAQQVLSSPLQLSLLFTFIFFSPLSALAGFPLTRHSFLLLLCIHHRSQHERKQFILISS